MIGLDAVYALTGFLLAGVAILCWRERGEARRMTNALFWGLLAVSFLAGGKLGDFANGCLVIALALIAGLGGLARGGGEDGGGAASAEARRASALRHGDRLFIPALTIPLVTLVGVLGLARLRLGGRPLIDPAQAAPVSLALGAVAALAVACVMLRPRAIEPLRETRRFLHAVGWAPLLPQTLAALGVVFTLAHVGPLIGGAVTHWLPTGSRLAAVCAFTIGMAVFTMLMGNAFAAFPVMATAIGLPLIVGRFGGDAAVMGAIGMLSGYCGTLLTPLAANFNIVPAALLDLKDRNGVIKVQAPTAVILLLANTALMSWLAFRR